MAYLFYELETETRAKVYGINADPMDLLTEEQKKNAIEVKEVPKEEYLAGKTPEYYVNPKTKEVWIEYKDRDLTDKEEIQQLKEENNDLKTALMELAEAAEANEVKSQLAIMELAELIGGQE